MSTLNNRSTRRPRRSRHSAFTMIEIMIVVVIAGILLNIATPALIRTRETSRAKTCVRNLRNIDGAKEQYALDNRLAPGAAGPAMTVLVGGGTTTGYLRSQPNCSSGGSYTIDVIGTLPSCSKGANVSSQTYDDHIIQ